MSKIKTTPRGFNIYGSFRDDHQNTVRVQESSEVGRPRVWIFPDPETAHPYLSVVQAKRLIRILERFVQDAQSPENWRNKKPYRKMWG